MLHVQGRVQLDSGHVDQVDDGKGMVSGSALLMVGGFIGGGFRAAKQLVGVVEELFEGGGGDCVVHDGAPRVGDAATGLPTGFGWQLYAG